MGLTLIYMYREDLMHSRKLWSLLSLVLALTLLLSACAPPTSQMVEVVVTKEVLITPIPEPQAYAEYVFLFIGDGMGVAQRNAAELYLAATANADARPEDTRLPMNTFPAQGMNTTYDLTSAPLP